MTKKILTLILLAVFLALPVLFLNPVSASAQLYRPPSPYGQSGLATLAANIESAIWIIFTCVAVVCFVVAGILFLTAAGQPDKLQQARSAFLWGIAGVIIGILAFSMVEIITSLLGKGS